MNNIIAAVN